MTIKHISPLKGFVLEKKMKNAIGMKKSKRKLDG